MNPVIALDNALVAPDDRVKIGKCNMRINLTKTNKEATYQVVLDTLSLSPCYNAFTNTADVPEIYMQQLPNQEFIEPPSHDEIVTFIKSLGYKGPLESIPDLVVDHMGEDNEVYGISIPDVMINQDIENYKAYKTYLAYSTGAATPKKARKWKQPKTTSSLSVDDNIIFEDRDAAFELAKSISRTEAEEQEAARLMHETHERLVTKKPTKRRQTSVVFRDTPIVPQKKPLDQSQKLKGFQVMSIEERLVADTKKAIKASKLATRLQQTEGSNKGASLIPEVSDEPTDSTGANDDSKYAHEDEYIHKDVDKRTESDNEDQAMGDAEKNDEDKVEEEKYTDQEPIQE
ncbi:hypothetical protein Tco_1193788 [Tanacetum coccineum]